MAEQKVNDWRTMGPGPELDRLIAEKLGYTVTSQVDPDDGRTWYMLRLEGRRIDSTIYRTEAEAWASFGNPSTDPNATLRLLDTIPTDRYIVRIIRTYRGGEKRSIGRNYLGEQSDVLATWAVYINEVLANETDQTIDGLEVGRGMADRDSLAEAICMAWLAWEEKNP